MVLISHIIISLCSLIFASYAIIKPSSKKLIGSYSLVAATLISGTYLVVSTKSSMISACVTGLAYTLLVVTLTLLAKIRLQRIK